MVTVDDDRLAGILVTLNEEMTLLNAKRTTLRNLSEITNSIKLLIIPAPTAENINATSTVLPLDPKLGVTITTDRREAIYDKLLSDVAALFLTTDDPPTTDTAGTEE